MAGLFDFLQGDPRYQDMTGKPSFPAMPSRPLDPNNLSHVVLHDRGGAYNGQSPYHIEVLPDGKIMNHWKADQRAPHAHNFNGQSIGVAYGGPVGGPMTPEALESMKFVTGGLRKANPNLQFQSHGEAYAATKGTDRQASKEGRGLDEASWRSNLGLTQPPAAPQVDDGRPGTPSMLQTAQPTQMPDSDIQAPLQVTDLTDNPRFGEPYKPTMPSDERRRPPRLEIDGEAGPRPQGLGGGQPQQEMSFLERLTRNMSSPLFLAGAALVSGQGFKGAVHGMQLGSEAQKNYREIDNDTKHRAALNDALQNSPVFADMSPSERAAIASNPKLADQVFNTIYSHKYDPLTPGKLQLQQAQAEYYRARGDNFDARTNGAVAPPPARDFNKEFYRDDRGNLQRRDVLSSGDEIPDERRVGGLIPTADKGHGLPRGTSRVEITPPGPDATPAQLKAWAAANKEARKVNESDDRQNILENKPPQVKDNTLSDEEIQQYYDAKYPGVRKNGGESLWRRDGTLQKLSATQGERSATAIAHDGIESVRNARKLLEGKNFLQEAGGFGITVPGVGTVRLGKNINQGSEDASIAEREMRAAMHDVLKAMSGATVSNAERADYVDMYMPSAWDTKKERQFKLDRMETFFARTIAAGKTGATQDDISRMIKNGLQNGIGPPSAITPKTGDGFKIERVP
jgi:N-acetylmuramoyl-L-alanine amidase